MNGTSSLAVARFKAAAKDVLYLPAIALFELHFGVANSGRPIENARRLEAFLTLPLVVLPFDLEDSVAAGTIRAILKRLGTPIGPYDVLIAAQARRRGATLVTANTREFSRVPGLKLEDWTVA